MAHIASIDEGRVARLRTVLEPHASHLLGTGDAELFRTRLLALRVDEQADDERDQLGRLVAVRLGERHSWWERGARLALLACHACWVLVLVWLAAAYLAVSVPDAVLRALHVPREASLAWPPTPGSERTMVGLGVLAACLGLLGHWLRSRDVLRTARLALEEACHFEPETWPGIPVDSPFAARANVWGFGALVLGLGVLAVVGWRLTGHHVGAGAVLLAVMALALAALLAWLGHQLRRIDALASRALFVGRV